MLSAISSQNCSSVNFGAINNVTRGRVVNTWLRQLTEYTNTDARLLNISLKDAYERPCHLSSRVNHFNQCVKNRRPNVGKMKYSA